MKKHCSPLFLLGAALLASCTNPGGTASESVHVDIDSSSAASLMLSLRKARDYTVKSELYAIGAGNALVEATTVYFRDASYHVVGSNYDLGYILGEEGVFPFSVQNGAFLPGETLKGEDGQADKDLHDGAHFLSFSSFSEESLLPHVGEEQFAVKDKAGRLALLDMAGLDRTNYPSLSSVTASLQDGNLRIVGYLTLDSAAYSLSWTVSDIQSTRDFAVEEFLEDGGKAFVPDEALQKSRSLFALDNFTHFYENEAGKVIAYERFNPEYYFLTAGSEGMAQGLVPSGMVGVERAVSPSGKLLDGCYSVTPTSSQDGLLISDISVLEAFPYNSSTSDVSVAFHYPSRLMLWESLEWAKKQDALLHEGYDAHYRTSNYAIVVDFASNVGALALFEQLGLTPVALSLETASLGESGKEEILFTLLASSGQGMEFRFGDFGLTNVAVMDAWIAKLTAA